MVVLFTDGASKNNPGIAGIGYVLYIDDILIKEGSYIIPLATNNVAEVVAILVGLYECKSLINSKEIILKSDSLLLISQFKKIYKIKNPVLLKAHTIFNKYFRDLKINFQYISRNFNTHADMLANKGIHENISLSQSSSDFISCLFNNNQ